MSRRLPKAKEDRIVALWEDGCHVLCQIAKAVGVYPITVRNVLDRRGVEVNGHLKHNGSEPDFIPTPERIKAMTAEYQRGWSEATKRKRSVLKPQPPYTIPEVHGVKDDGTTNERMTPEGID